MPPSEKSPEPCAGGSASASIQIFAALASMRIDDAILESGRLGASFASPAIRGAKARITALRLGGAKNDRPVPAYVLEAARDEEKIFNLPTNVYEGLLKNGTAWAANARFLDRGIKIGAEFRLATPLASMGKSTFRDEVRYLLDRGYRVSADGTRLIPKR